MNERNTNDSIEERLRKIEEWQFKNQGNLRNDYMEYTQRYQDAPMGVYAPNFNDIRYIKNANESLSSEDFRIDMGGDKFNSKILNEDFINELVEDTLLVEQTPEVTKLQSEKGTIAELKSMARIIKQCEKYIKNDPRVHQSFVDAVKMLKMQYEEAISHLGNMRNLPAGDFIQMETLRLWNLRNFNKSMEKMDELSNDFYYDFENIILDL